MSLRDNLQVIKVGIVLFQELLGVGFNRIVRLDLASGECHKTWPLQSMKSWTVNWDIKQVPIGDRNLVI